MQDKITRLYVNNLINMDLIIQKYSSVQFSRSVMSDSLQPHES